MDRVRKSTYKEVLPELDKEEKIFYMCPFCNFSTQYRGDIHYHVVGYHKILQEFFDEF